SRVTGSAGCQGSSTSPRIIRREQGRATKPDGPPEQATQRRDLTVHPQRADFAAVKNRRVSAVRPRPAFRVAHLLAKRSRRVVALLQPALLKDGCDPFDKVLKRAGNGVGIDVESVHTRVSPLSDAVHDLLGSSDDAQLSDRAAQQVGERPIL